MRRPGPRIVAVDVVLGKIELEPGAATRAARSHQNERPW